MFDGTKGKGIRQLYENKPPQARVGSTVHIHYSSSLEPNK